MIDINRTDFNNNFQKFIFKTRVFLDLSYFLKSKLHRDKIKKSKKLYKLINSNRFKDNPGAIFSYLRKIDPFVFEELLLISFQKKGYKIKRNSAYTKDGGIDGKIVLKTGKLIAIQAKRYSSHINPDHVATFCNIVNNDFDGGLFIHTGRTGNLSYKNCSNKVSIISGKSLLNLLKEPTT